MTNQRESKASDPELITDPDLLARREAENAVRQFDRVLDMIDEVERDGRPFKLRLSKIYELHRVAMEGISAYAGSTRPGNIEIGQSKHIPPAAHLVHGLLEEMCDWVNENWQQETALKLCAYIMWRLNWIHPFTDGNGRTSRSLAYLVLCARLGYRLPGGKTIPEQIAADKPPYYAALEDADTKWATKELDLMALEQLLEHYLAIQLAEVWEGAKSAKPGNPDNNDRKFH